MLRLAILLIAILFIFGKDKPFKGEKVVFDRIVYVFNLKQEIDKEVWGSFNDKVYDVPLIYYTDTSSYIANPTKKFLNTFKSNLVFKNNQVEIYKTNQRIDNLPFHMETSLTLGDPTDEYDYHSPFMKCSSYEETVKKIPDVLSTEEWATMIIHEYFHGFQFKHQAYIDFYEKKLVQIPRDSLTSLYKNNDWFKTSIDKENEILVKAINETESIKRYNLIVAFFELRNDRRKNTEQKLHFDLEKYEKHYETIEGTARYVEYNLYNIFSRRQPDKLLKADTSFKSYDKFLKYKIENDKWLYITEKTPHYVYAIGFNMARLLDKLQIDFKSNLFKHGGLSLEDILNKKVRN